MSLVYKAKQIQLERIVAVKVLSTVAVSGENNSLRFQSESKLTASLNHPNIVKTYGAGLTQDDEPYLLLEFIDGYSLAAELKKGGSLSYGRFAEIFIPLLSALNYAHESGLVHRDIKPGNIMLCRTPDGAETAKLVDFGIAKICSEVAEHSQNITQTGAVVGSPLYMSPEQCQSKALDGRSDIYSISAVMYESLTGEALFSGDSDFEVMHKHSLANPPSVKELLSKFNVPERLGQVILWGLSKKKEDRPQTALELRNKLSDVLSDLTLDRSPRPVAIKQSSRLQIAFVSLLALTLAIAVSGTVGLNFTNQKKSVVASLDKSTMKLLGDQAVKAANDLEDFQPREAFSKWCEAVADYKKSGSERNYFHALKEAVMCGCRLYSDLKDKENMDAVRDKCLEMSSEGLSLLEAKAGKDAEYRKTYVLLCETDCALKNDMKRYKESADLANKYIPIFDRLFVDKVYERIARGSAMTRFLLADKRIGLAEKFARSYLEQLNSCEPVVDLTLLRARLYIADVFVAAKKGDEAFSLAKYVEGELLRNDFEKDRFQRWNIVSQLCDVLRKLGKANEMESFIAMNEERQSGCYENEPEQLAKLWDKVAQTYEAEGKSSKALSCLKLELKALNKLDSSGASLELRRACLEDLLDTSKRLADRSKVREYSRLLEAIH